MGSCASVPAAASTATAAAAQPKQQPAAQPKQQPAAQPKQQPERPARTASPNSSAALACTPKENLVQEQHGQDVAVCATASEEGRDANLVSSLASQSEKNFTTHWRCDEGVMWPQDVNYCSQCPRGHSLSSCSSLPCCHVCGGDANMCMSCSEGCSYGVCASCLAAINHSNTQHAPDVPADHLELNSSGVSPSFLKAFKAKWSHVTRGWSTGQVRNLLVKALTSRSRGSVCEDLVREGSGQVGQATLVLSHSWGNLFEDTVEAALQAVDDAGFSNKETTFIWFDIFSCRQHATSQQCSSALLARFSEIVAKTGNMAVVLHPFDKPLALKRAWCIFELYSCLQSGGKLHVALTPSESDRFVERSEADVGASAEFTAFNAMLSTVDTKSASCTLHEDQAAIFRVLEKDAGIEKIDEVVKQGLVSWLSSQQQQPESHEEEVPAKELAEACALYAAAKKHQDDNMFSQGEQLARRAAELRTHVLGAANIETLAANLLLASLLKKQKKMDEAQQLYEEALATARQVLGNDHEETLACMNNLAVLLKQQGKLDDARALYEEALGFKRSKLGAHHASTLTSISNLAGLLKAQGKLQEARLLYEESLQGHRSTLGPLHAGTLTDIWNFALFLNKVGERDASAALLRECYEGWEQVLGADHLNTIMCKKAMEQLGIK